MISLLVLSCLLAVDGLRAQLVIRTPRQNWRPGEIVEIALPESAGQQGVRVHEVHFNDEPIPFEVIQPAVRGLLLRIRVPLRIRSGAHGIKVFLTERIEEVAVPSVEGLTFQEAENRVRSAGLRIDSGDFRPASSEFKVDRVKNQDPAPGGRVRRGGRIAVEISSYSIVPRVLRLSLQEASERLEERGLLIGTPQRIAGLAFPSSPSVGSQNPLPGEEALVGAVVSVEIDVLVPQLLGVEIEQARQLLQIEGLPLLLVTRSAGEGPFETVLLQQPEPGTRVASGTPVRVTIELQPNWLLSLWPFALLAALLGAAVAGRARVKRLATRRSYQLQVSRDLERLRRDTPPPIWSGRELKLDVRLVGRLDPGEQTIRLDGLLVGEEAKT